MFRKLLTLSVITAFTSYSVKAQDATPDDHWDLSAMDWFMFGAGVLVGFAEQLATKGVESSCIADSASLAVSGVHAADYMNEYLDSNKTDNAALAYALVYIVDFFEVSSTWNCDNVDEELNAWLNELTSSFSGEKTENTDETLVVESSSPIVYNHEDFGCDDCFGGDDPNNTPDPEEDNLDDINLIDGMLIFVTVRDILSDIEIILQLVETGVNSNQVWDNWKEAKYFTAGYHFGLSGLGFGILVDDIVTKYKDMSLDYDSATDLAEDHEE